MRQRAERKNQVGRSTGFSAKQRYHVADAWQNRGPKQRSLKAAKWGECIKQATQEALAFAAGEMV